MSEEMVVLPGERCRKAREALGWSTREAANRMHLSHSYLLALEADDYERLPEATFVKGYLKNYARLLGLPADDVANTFQQMVNEDAFNKPLQLPSIPRPRSLLGRPWVWLVLVLLVVVGVLMLWPFGASEDTRPDPLGAVESTDTTGQPAEPQGMLPPPVRTQPSRDESEQQGADSGQLDSEPELDGDQSPAQPESQAVGGTQAASDEQTPLAENGLDRLVASFSANCWIQIKDANGRTLRQGEQQQGASLQIDGKAPFSVTLGNAGAVQQMLLNGEPVTLPTDSPGKVVRISLP